MVKFFTKFFSTFGRWKYYRVITFEHINILMSQYGPEEKILPFIVISLKCKFSTLQGGSTNINPSCTYKHTKHPELPSKYPQYILKTPSMYELMSTVYELYFCVFEVFTCVCGLILMLIPYRMENSYCFGITLKRQDCFQLAILRHHNNKMSIYPWHKWLGFCDIFSFSACHIIKKQLLLITL